MKKILKILLFSCLCQYCIDKSIAGPTLKASKNFINAKDWAFIPNTGQLKDGQGNVISDVQYYGHQAGAFLYCRPGKISFVFTKSKPEQNNISEATGQPSGIENSPKNIEIVSTRADMILIGANTASRIIASEQQAYYENYILAAASLQHITNVHPFKTLTYKDIYPNIDMVLHSRAQGMKYEFIVHPGGKVSDIQIQWYGLSKTQATAFGGIKYSLPLDNDHVSISESAPVSFTEIGHVASQFIIHGNRIGFKLGHYDHNKTLTIDPELNWGSYFGGSVSDFSRRISTDPSGNVIMIGHTQSTSGVVSSGAFQTHYAGSYDIVLARFSNSGGIIWSSYYGGSGNDQAYGLKVDGSGNIYVSGVSNSSGMATLGAYQFSYTGTNDAILAKFIPSGDISWATYMGGFGDDAGLAVALDGSGNVYMSGRTQSDGLATSGAYQTSRVIKNMNTALLAKFTNSGSLVWATYYGGNGNTTADAIDADKSGNIFLSGFTQSDGMATSGAYQTSYYGFVDIFLTKFTSNGTVSWATYFGGAGTDYCYDAKTDASGNVYLTGSTLSVGMATSGAYQTSYSRVYADAYLAKFSASGSLLWSTYLGGDLTDISNALCMDKDENIYIAGNTSSSSGIATPGAYQGTYTKAADAFMAKFDKSGTMAWSTYYGGTGDDIIYGICVDADNNIFITGTTSSESDIATPNAYRQEIQGPSLTQTDIFVSKFSRYTVNNAGLVYIKSPTGKGCAGNISTQVIVKNYGSVPITSLTIGWLVDSIPQNDYKWTGNLAPGDTLTINTGNTLVLPVGGYAIKAYVSQPNGVTDSMPGNDTLTTKFIAHPVQDTAWLVTNSGPKFSFKVKDSTLDPKYYLWILSDGSHSAGYSFSYEFHRVGTYDVKLIVGNTFACVNIHDTSFYVANAGLGYDPKTNPNNISIYPNPFSDKTIIHFNNPEVAQVRIIISDMLGKVLYNSTAKDYSPGDNEIEINSAEARLSTGSYFVTIIIGTETVVKKVVLMK